MKPVTGQYECVHGSGVGLDYFTARIDTLTLYANGRFTLKVQQKSRVSHAAQSLMQGQQVNTNAPENLQEGTYLLQGLQVQLTFANGGFEGAQLNEDGTDLAIGPNHFTKVSDSTSLPPTHRMQQNMDDIAKGLKIASTLGGIAVKAAKTIQSTMQTTQGQDQQNTAQSQPQYGQNTPPSQPQYGQNTPPSQPQYGRNPPPSRPQYGQNPPPSQAAPQQPYYTPPQQQPAAPRDSIYCDQCGARLRPGKRFCNNCGAHLDG